MKRISARSGGRAVLSIVIFAGFFFAGCTPPPLPPPGTLPPTKDVETEQFTKGMRAFQTHRYDVAVQYFTQVIAMSPGSPLLMEAQWYLSQAYMVSGKKDLAIRELSLFLSNYSESPYRNQAHLLLSQMEWGHNKVVAIEWSPGITPHLRDVLRHVNDPGVNTVILTLPQEQWVRMGTKGRPETSDPLSTWIQTARQEQLHVFVKIPLRMLPGVGNAEGGDLRSERGKTESPLDIFHPEARARLIQLCRNLAHYPLDGVNVDQIAYRMDEGKTAAAQALYQNLFFEKLTERETMSSAQSWRFVGLKSRYMVDLLHAMRMTVQSVRSQITFGISIPEILLTHPRDGLMQSSLDYVQLKAAQFDFYVITERQASDDILFASLGKYDAFDKTWLEGPPSSFGEEAFSRIPIQGIVLARR